ncbi:hypothetical protein ABL850_31525 [Variovorax paradoxus]|uniref:hypothetical protein n=1 Tax=Variovorax paradoxus TaxID=34073 RepID=UPI0004170297
MATPLNLDPFDMWRQAVTKLEEGMNALGTRSLKTDEVGKALLQFSAASTQMRQLMDKASSKYLKSINLASRKEVIDLAETLRRIEDKLDRLLPQPEQPPAPRPARTRRPGTAAAATHPAAEIAPAAPATGSKARRAVAGAARPRKAA